MKQIKETNENSKSQLMIFLDHLHCLQLESNKEVSCFASSSIPIPTKEMMPDFLLRKEALAH